MNLKAVKLADKVFWIGAYVHSEGLFEGIELIH
jgi:urease accessory protein UreF